MRLMPGEIIALRGRNNAYPLPKTSSNVPPAPRKGPKERVLAR